MKNVAAKHKSKNKDNPVVHFFETKKKLSSPNRMCEESILTKKIQLIYGNVHYILLKNKYKKGG